MNRDEPGGSTAEGMLSSAHRGGRSIASGGSLCQTSIGNGSASRGGQTGGPSLEGESYGVSHPTTASLAARNRGSATSGRTTSSSNLAEPSADEAARTDSLPLSTGTMGVSGKLARMQQQAQAGGKQQPPGGPSLLDNSSLSLQDTTNNTNSLGTCTRLLSSSISREPPESGSLP